MYIPCICKAYPILSNLYFWHTYRDAMKVGRIGNTCTQHGSTGQQLECTQMICFTHSQDIRGIYHVYTMYITCIYHLYTMYITCIYHAYTSYLTIRARFVAHAHLAASAISDLLSLGHREAAHARLGLSKVPQPGVDLINMAAPTSGRARTIGTATLKSVPLSATVLMWNS